MAGRQDRLVKAIRNKRRTLMRAVEQSAGPLDPLRDSVRRHPAAWAFGSVLVGVVVVRSLGGTLLRGGRRLAGTWARGRVGAALVGAATKAYTIVKSEFEPPPRARAESPQGSAHAESARPVGQPASVPPRSSRSASGAAASMERQDPQAFSRP